MHLSKRNKIYYVFYRKNGKYTCKSTGTKYKSEALRFLVEFRDKLNQSKSGLTFKEFAVLYLKDSESIHSPKTTTDYKQTFRFFEKLIGNLVLPEITTSLINEYLQKRIKVSSIYQARKDIINLKRAFNFAVENGYLTENPCNTIKRIKLPEKKPIYFTRDEFNVFLSVIDNKDFKDLVILAVNTGLRQMELLTLSRDQVDLEKKIITLDNRLHITKSKKTRVVPINKRALKVLAGRINYEPMFPFSQDRAIRLFAKYRKQSNIRKELTFHSLRHTFASWLVENGVSIFNVSKLLGHSDVKTTQIYAHVNRKVLLDSVETIDY